MAGLSASDFFKPSTPSRPDRKLLFLQKYQNKEPFQLISGINVVFKFEKNVYNKIAGLIPGDNKGYASIVLKDTNDKQYKMTSIQKTKEFGGGGGSGAGAENTKLNESSVCLWAAVYLKTGNSSFSSVIANWDDSKEFYDVDETDKKMISQTDQIWINHYERCAVYLVDQYCLSDDYIFHRGSKFVNDINNKFKELNKKMERPFANINKWSPADIWLSKKGFKLNFDQINVMDEFNRYLLNELNKENIIGVSLKKTSGKVHQTNYNVGETRPAMLYNGYRVVAPKGNIFSSKDVYVYAKGEDDISMQVRSFDDLSGYQGELIGKVAKYGKIAHGPINMILEDIGLKKLPDQQSIISKARLKDEIMAKDLYKIFSKYANPGMSEDNFLITLKSSEIKSDWLFSKYLGVKLIDILESTTATNKNEFVQGALGYALSNTKHSAPFIKLY